MKKIQLHLTAAPILQFSFLTQGRREGVKGVKMGPGNLENKKKIGYSKEILLFWRVSLLKIWELSFRFQTL
jgi:hypothetical protein